MRGPVPLSMIPSKKIGSIERRASPARRAYSIVKEKIAVRLLLPEIRSTGTPQCARSLGLAFVLSKMRGAFAFASSRLAKLEWYTRYECAKLFFKKD